MTRVRGDPRRQSTYQKTGTKRTHVELETDQTTVQSISQSKSQSASQLTAQSSQSTSQSTNISSTTVKSTRKSKKPKLSLDEDDVIETHFTDTIDAKPAVLTQAQQTTKVSSSSTTSSSNTIASKPKRRKTDVVKPVKSPVKFSPIAVPPPQPKPIIIPVPSLPALQPSASCVFAANARREDLIKAITQFYQHELAAQLSVCETVYGVAAETQPHSYLTAFTQQVCDVFIEQLPSILDPIPLTVNVQLPPCKHENKNAVNFWRDAVERAELKLSEFQAAQHQLNETFIQASSQVKQHVETAVDVIVPDLDERTRQGYDSLTIQTQVILDHLTYMENELQQAREWRIRTAQQAKQHAFGGSDKPNDRPAAIKELVRSMVQPVSPMTHKR